MEAAGSSRSRRQQTVASRLQAYSPGSAGAQGLSVTVFAAGGVPTATYSAAAPAPPSHAHPRVPYKPGGAAAFALAALHTNPDSGIASSSPAAAARATPATSVHTNASSTVSRTAQENTSSPASQGANTNTIRSGAIPELQTVPQRAIQAGGVGTSLGSLDASASWDPYADLPSGPSTPLGPAMHPAAGMHLAAPVTSVLSTSTSAAAAAEAEEEASLLSHPADARQSQPQRVRFAPQEGASHGITPTTVLNTSVTDRAAASASHEDPIDMQHYARVEAVGGRLLGPDPHEVPRAPANSNAVTLREDGMEGEQANLPYYQSGAARARLEVFERRGKLAAELTSLGLPPVQVEYKKGLLIGSTHDPRKLMLEEAAQAQAAAAALKEEPRWRQLRSRMNDPAHNPILQRNMLAKAKLAEQMAQRQVAAAESSERQRARRAAREPDPSRLLPSKMHVVGASQPARVSSQPVSKPYHPKRDPKEPPCNEEQGGNTGPGRIARLVAQHHAAAHAAAERHAVAAALDPHTARLQRLAAAILAAPEHGIRMLGVYLPGEVPPPPPPPPPLPGHTPTLNHALAELQRAGEAAQRAMEDTASDHDSMTHSLKDRGEAQQHEDHTQEQVTSQGLGSSARILLDHKRGQSRVQDGLARAAGAGQAAVQSTHSLHKGQSQSPPQTRISMGDPSGLHAVIYPKRRLLQDLQAATSSSSAQAPMCGAVQTEGTSAHGVAITNESVRGRVAVTQHSGGAPQVFSGVALSASGLALAHESDALQGTAAASQADLMETHHAPALNQSQSRSQSSVPTGLESADAGSALQQATQTHPAKSPAHATSPALALPSQLERSAHAAQGLGHAQAGPMRPLGDPRVSHDSNSSWGIDHDAVDERGFPRLETNTRIAAHKLGPAVSTDQWSVRDQIAGTKGPALKSMLSCTDAQRLKIVPQATHPIASAAAPEECLSAESSSGSWGVVGDGAVVRGAEAPSGQGTQLGSLFSSGGPGHVVGHARAHDPRAGLAAHIQLTKEAMPLPVHTSQQLAFTTVPQWLVGPATWFEQEHLEYDAEAPHSMQGSLDGAMMTTRPSGQEQDDGPVAEALARALCTRHTPPRAHIAAAAQRLGPTLDFTPPNHGGVQ